MNETGVEEWFGARTLYELTIEGAPNSVVEERVVVFRAGDADAALEMAELEALAYAAECHWPNADGDTVRGQYLGSCNVFSIKDELSHGVEIFSASVLVKTPATPSDLVDRFCGTAEEEAASLSSFEPDFERIASNNLGQSQW